MNNSEKSYNEIPYISKPYRQTHPSYLKAICSLNNIETANFETANILEIGCSFGGNIIPIAQHNPNVNIIGIDLSSVQITEGQKIIKRMGLTNIQLLHQNILDYDIPNNYFDYIICHGVYSWVPEIVRNAILSAINKGLSNKGVAIVSYNTYPGWKMKEIYRDAMVYHSHKIEDPMIKCHYAIEMLDFLKENINPSSPSGVAIAKDYQDIKNASFYYFMHEYLENDNQPFYFHEFIDAINKYDLTYIMDADIGLNFSYPNSPSKNILKQIETETQGNIIKEQLKDFISNRQFRRSIICKNTASFADKIDYSNNIQIELFKNIYLTDMLLQSNVAENELLEFIVSELKLSETRTIQLKTLLDKWQKQKKDFNTQDFFSTILNLIIQNSLPIMSHEIKGYKKIDKCPKIAKSTRELIKYINEKTPSPILFTNAEHLAVELNIIDFEILPLLNGTNTIEKLYKQILQAVNEERIIIKDKEDKNLKNSDALQNAIKEHVDTALNKMMMHGFLEQP